MYMNTKITYYKLHEARPNLSKMLNKVADSYAYIIGNRDEPKAVLIDIKTANKYLPDDYSYKPSTKNKKIKDGEKFYIAAMKLLEKRKLSKIPKIKINDLDKIIYG